MGLSPESFAARLGCEPGLILCDESGHARVGALALWDPTRLCQVRVGYFLTGTGNDGPERPLAKGA
jgi:hypothetical protein